MTINCYRHSGTGSGSTYDTSLANNSLDFPCGNPNSTDPFVFCCVNGDICMSNGFCYYTHSLAGGSGYYVASCTNPAAVGEGCANRCTDQDLPDVVYNETSGLWQCCGADSNGSPDCPSPTDETFNAPAPSNLVQIFSVPRDGWTATSISIASTLSQLSTTSYSNQPLATISSPASSASSIASSLSNHSSTLSTGASAGIGIGAVFSGVFLLGIVFLLWRRRKSHEAGKTTAAQEVRETTMANIREQQPCELAS